MEWLTDLEEARAEARRRGQPLFALVTVDWCPWCRMMEAETLTDPAVQLALSGLALARLDGDGHEDLPDQYNFEVYPAVLLFSPEGDHLGLIEGYVEPAELLDQLQKLLEE
jgi:thiol:disulfide interchange protein